MYSGRATGYTSIGSHLTRPLGNIGRNVSGSVHDRLHVPSSE